MTFNIRDVCQISFVHGQDLQQFQEELLQMMRKGWFVMGELSICKNPQNQILFVQTLVIYG